MNPINSLLDEKFVINLFSKKVLPKYQDFKSIKKIRISTPKKKIWEKTYHLVVRYIITFRTIEGKYKTLSVYATAHSNEERKNVYDVLRFLWTHEFNKGYLTIPHPLFYDRKFNATFYRGVDGHHLLYYIRLGDKEVIEKIVEKVAKWLAKLHKLPVDGVKKNFNNKNNRIINIVPGIEKIFKKINEEYPEHLSEYKKIYSILIKKEQAYLKRKSRRWLVHGDIHPENVIKMGKKKVAVIDFADTCLSDFARDLGSFLQQIEYMMGKNISDLEYINKVKNLFLDTYLKSRKIKIDEDLEERIYNYYNWTMLRTATYFFIRENPDYTKGNYLFRKVCKNLGL